MVKAGGKEDKTCIGSRDGMTEMSRNVIIRGLVFCCLEPKHVKQEKDKEHNTD